MSGEAEMQSWWKKALKGLWDNKIFIFGLAMTGGYVWALFCHFDFSFSEFQSLDLNEKGEVLGGVFGPLAMFWLILGFWQQGQELKLQVRELGNSVDALKNQANAMNAQIGFEKSREFERTLSDVRSFVLRYLIEACGLLTGEKFSMADFPTSPDETEYFRDWRVVRNLISPVFEMDQKVESNVELVGKPCDESTIRGFTHLDWKATDSNCAFCFEKISAGLKQMEDLARELEKTPRGVLIEWEEFHRASTNMLKLMQDILGKIDEKVGYREMYNG
ncbi:MAG: hypothetical protein ABF335_06425 [Alphaproteobacteria bacterium]